VGVAGAGAVSGSRAMAGVLRIKSRLKINEKSKSFTSVRELEW
jgi:hypothetical protein